MVLEHGPRFDTMGYGQSVCVVRVLMDKDICWKGLCGCYRQRKKSEILDAGQKSQGRKLFLEQKY
jgi:hypothetical protein